MFYFAVVKQSAYGVYPDMAFAIASSIFRTNLGVQLLVHTYGPTLCDNHPGARSCCLYIIIQQADAVHSVVRQRTRHSCILHEHDRTRIIRSYAASKLFGYSSCARKMPSYLPRVILPPTEGPQSVWSRTPVDLRRSAGLCHESCYCCCCCRC